MNRTDASNTSSEDENLNNNWNEKRDRFYNALNQL